MSNETPDNSCKTQYYVPRFQKRKGFEEYYYHDFDELGFTREELMERAERLRQRHEELLATNPRYREVWEQLPDRSGFKSPVDIMVPATTAFIQMVRGRIKYARSIADRARYFAASERKKRINNKIKRVMREILQHNEKSPD